jgi:hypothetical protein
MVSMWLDWFGRFQGFEILRFLGIKVSRLQFDVPRFLGTKVLRFLGITVSGFQEC